MPDLPLTLNRKQAADLLGLQPSGFDSWVRRGIVPGPIAGTRRWSRAAIERAISGEPATTIEDDLSPYERWKRDSGLSPFESEMAARGLAPSEAHRSRGRAYIREMHEQWKADPKVGPLGQREKAVLLAILNAGDRTLDHSEVPYGPSTHMKLAARGYLVGAPDALYTFRLTAEGRKAAAAIEP